jgi:hypothetical protein
MQRKNTNGAHLHSQITPKQQILRMNWRGRTMENKLLQDLDPIGSPHIEEELIDRDYRSSFPLPNLSKRSMNHTRDREESRF